MSAAPPSGRRKALAARKRREAEAEHQKTVLTLLASLDAERAQRVELQKRLADLEAKARREGEDPVGHAHRGLEALAEARSLLAVEIDVVVHRARRLGLTLEHFHGSVAQAWRVRRTSP